jgi:hypothetical protein
MNQINKIKSFEEILRDAKHNSKANEVFLKLLARQKSKHKDWSSVKSQTYPIKDTKLGGYTDDYL